MLHRRQMLDEIGFLDEDFFYTMRTAAEWVIFLVTNSRPLRGDSWLRTSSTIDCFLPPYYYGITSTILSPRLFSAVIWIAGFCRNSSASSRAATVSK